MCKHLATSDLQRYSMPRSTAREMKEEDAPKEETLSDYIQEYESKSWKIKEHLSFQEFFQLKEERRSNNRRRRGIFFLPNFDGSSTCTTEEWIDQLDSYLYIHKVSEKEALKVETLHL